MWPRAVRWGVLRHTFLHIDGVGYRTEARLWRSGIRTWDEASARPARLPVPPRLAARIEGEVGRSEDALRKGRHAYFAHGLPARERWRAWADFRGRVAYLDIETTGLSIGRDAITVVGVYDGERERSFVKGVNLSRLPEALAAAKLLVTYNGARFDLPFLRRAFPRMRLDQIHLDLRYPLRRLGYRGGLKAIEEQVGIARSDETAGLGGFDAVRLWEQSRRGDPGALDLLLEYNMEDVVHLEALSRLAYRELRTWALEGDFVTADRLLTASGRAP
jgi:hypothetical protein